MAKKPIQSDEPQVLPGLDNVGPDVERMVTEPAAPIAPVVTASAPVGPVAPIAPVVRSVREPQAPLVTWRVNEVVPTVLSCINCGQANRQIVTGQQVNTYFCPVCRHVWTPKDEVAPFRARGR